MLEKMQEAATPGVGRMADKLEEVARGGEAAAYREREEQGSERAKTILSELLDAARSAAETILENQKQQTAERVSGMAEAVRCAAQSLDQAENRAIARYADQAADRIEDFSRLIRERRWNEIVADTEDLARRQPTLFALGAAAIGFLAGRLLAVPTDRRHSKKDIPQTLDLGPHRGETDEITAAVSKLATQPPGGASKLAGNGAELDERSEGR
jgi:ElaB/YqjD/DUF883 family membrane-anchored ribosome-binding protein